MKKEYNYLDLHVAGEPFRLLTKVFDRIPGKTMEEKRKYAESELDGLRKAVLLEPRGHKDMYGGILTPPVNSGSSFGILFIHGSGFSTMCGHGIIALARAAAELHLIEPEEGWNEIAIDAPSATVHARIRMVNGEPAEAAFENTLSFLYQGDVPVETPTFGPVSVDIGYGGAFMAFLDANAVGVDLGRDSAEEILPSAMECMQQVIEQVPMVHPKNPELSGQKNGICMILTHEEMGGEDEVEMRCFTAFGEQQYDRSPTGTGSSALAAVLFAKGRLRPDMNLVTRGYSGYPFQVSFRQSEGGILPTITARAYVTGKGSLIFEDGDDLVLDRRK